MTHSFNPLLQALMRTLVRGKFDRIVVCVTGSASYKIWHDLARSNPQGNPARDSIIVVGMLPYVATDGIALLQVYLDFRMSPCKKWEKTSLICNVDCSSSLNAISK